MRISVGLELNFEGRALAWALNYPGCYAYGSQGPDAVIALARALVSYEEWVNSHAGPGWLEIGDFDLRLVDTWEVYSINEQYELVDEGYEVNAWFRSDWKPLSAEEVEHGLKLLDWSREDFLRVVEGRPDEQLDRQREGERWSIRGIMDHVANAEWWYLDRLGEAKAADSLPQNTLERLIAVRQHLQASLQKMVGKEWVVGKDGEFWSPRKLLRRALWHEINHRYHIQKLLLEDDLGYKLEDHI